MGTKAFEFGSVVAGSGVPAVFAVRERVNHLIWATQAGVRGELCPQLGRAAQAPVSGSQRHIQASGLRVSGLPAGVPGYAGFGSGFSTDIDAARLMKTQQGSEVVSGTG